jgi:hypothetical protein
LMKSFEIQKKKKTTSHHNHHECEKKYLFFPDRVFFVLECLSLNSNCSVFRCVKFKSREGPQCCSGMLTATPKVPGKSWSFSEGLALYWESSLLKNKPFLEWPVCEVGKVIDLLTYIVRSWSTNWKTSLKDCRAIGLFFKFKPLENGEYFLNYFYFYFNF